MKRTLPGTKKSEQPFSLINFQEALISKMQRAKTAQGRRRSIMAAGRQLSALGYNSTQIFGILFDTSDVYHLRKEIEDGQD